MNEPLEPSLGWAGEVERLRNLCRGLRVENTLLRGYVTRVTEFSIAKPTKLEGFTAAVKKFVQLKREGRVLLEELE